MRGIPIAVVGMAGRFPSAPSVGDLWKLLCDGADGVATLDESTLRENEIDYDTLKDDPDYVPRAGVLEGAALWDASFFGYNTRQALMTDPQHRLWLESAWHAMEDAMFDPARAAERVAVFMGIGTRGNYLMSNLVPGRAYLEVYARNADVDIYETQLVNDRDYVATRTSHAFGLKGPAVTVQTACSTSLVAVVRACQSIWAGESDAALAGGASIQFPQARGYRHQPGGIFSRDGRTRSYDAAGSGTLFTCGVGAVLLQPLADAQAAGRPVHAVILGGATNNDGGRAESYIAPSLEGQATCISRAMDLAGVDARSIGYVEGHGTATPMGDPIEVQALTKAYRAHTRDRGFCALGSLKSNVGHMSTASGVGGLIKACLSIEHGWVPGTAHFRSPREDLHLADTPFDVFSEGRAWVGDGPRRAAVSSFGVGGTNAHVIIEEAP